MVTPDGNVALDRLEGKHAAIVVCWLLGNGCLFSWNSMLTIDDYYGYLFPRYHPSSFLTFVYQPFALGTIAILAYNEAKINTRKRNLFGYILFFTSVISVLVFLPSLDLPTSGKGGFGTFIGICATSAAFGVADAHVQGGMVGDLSFMQPEFVQASGALTSALKLIAKAAFENSRNVLFFAISALFELLCVLLYAYAFPKVPIVKYYRSKEASKGSKTVSADLAASGVQLLPLEESIFPGFLCEDTGSHGLEAWYALVLIAMYNLWDLIGWYVPLMKILKLESRKGLMVTILPLFLLIPAFYFTANYGDQGWMIMLASFLGLSNGYLIDCVLTSAPKGYKGPEQNALGNLLILFLIFAGVRLGWLWLIGKGW